MSSDLEAAHGLSPTHLHIDESSISLYFAPGVSLLLEFDDFVFVEGAVLSLCSSKIINIEEEYASGHHILTISTANGSDVRIYSHEPPRATFIEVSA